jgi:hypothetical protein
MNRRDLDAEDMEAMFCDHPYWQWRDSYRTRAIRVRECLNCGMVNPPNPRFPEGEGMNLVEKQDFDHELKISCYEFGVSVPPHPFYG